MGYTKRNDIAKSMGYNSFGQLEKAYNDALAYNKYRKLAGEIEAFDVYGRLDMTAEQRKNTRPDIDRTDVLFADGGVSYSIGYTSENQPVLVVNDNIISNATNEKELISIVKKSLGRFKRVPIQGQNIYFVSDTKKEYINSRYSQWLKKNDSTTFKDKMRLAGHPQDIVYATTEYINEGLNHPRKDNIIDFARGKILVDVSGRQYSAEVVIGFTKSGICELHDIVKMKATNFEYKKEATSESMDSNKESARSDVTSNNSISNPTENVNNNLKESARDTEYLELAKNPEQNREKLQRMLDKVARENGYPVEAYHGTARADRVGYVFLPERATSGAIYAISRSNEPTTNNNFDEKLIAEYITTLEDKEYDNKHVLERLLKAVSKNVGRVLGRYSSRSNRFVGYGRKVSQSGRNTQNESDRTGISGTDSQSVKYHDRNPEAMKQFKIVNLCHFVVLCNMCKSNVKYIYINILYNLCLKIHILHIFVFIKVKY